MRSARTTSGASIGGKFWGEEAGHKETPFSLNFVLKHTSLGLFSPNLGMV